MDFCYVNSLPNIWGPRKVIFVLGAKNLVIIQMDYFISIFPMPAMFDYIHKGLDLDY